MPVATGAEAELTSAVTDALLALATVSGVLYLRTAAPSSPERRAWLAGLSAFAAVASLGVVAHTVHPSGGASQLLWRTLWLFVGLGVGFLIQGAVTDWRGPDTAARAARGVWFGSALVYLATLATGDNFVVFAVWEALVLMVAVVAYASLAARRALDGAGLMVAAFLLTLAAGAVQATHSLSVHLYWRFDHNGLYHLLQLASVIAVVGGLRRTLGVQHS